MLNLKFYRNITSLANDLKALDNFAALDLCMTLYTGRFFYRKAQLWINLYSFALLGHIISFWFSMQGQNSWWTLNASVAIFIAIIITKLYKAKTFFKDRLKQTIQSSEYLIKTINHDKDKNNT